jgi:hypothetical protein
MGNVKHDVLIMKHFISKHLMFYFYVYCYLMYMKDRIAAVVTVLIQSVVLASSIFIFTHSSVTRVTP